MSGDQPGLRVDQVTTFRFAGSTEEAGRPTEFAFHLHREGVVVGALVVTEHAVHQVLDEVEAAIEELAAQRALRADRVSRGGRW